MRAEAAIVNKDEWEEAARSWVSGAKGANATADGAAAANATVDAGVATDAAKEKGAGDKSLTFDGVYLNKRAVKLSSQAEGGGAPPPSKPAYRYPAPQATATTYRYLGADKQWHVVSSPSEVPGASNQTANQTAR